MNPKLEKFDRVCEACQLRKQHKLPFLNKQTVNRGVVNVIHMGTGYERRYFTTFLDNFSRHAWIFPMQKKSKVLMHFQRLKNQVKKKMNQKIQCLWSNRVLLKQVHDIPINQRDMSMIHLSAHSSTKQSCWKKELSNSHSSTGHVAQKKMPKFFWAEVICTSIYLMNWSMTEGVHDETLYEKYFERKTDLSHVKVFGSIAYLHIPHKERHKLDPKSEKCILVRFSLNQKE